MELQALQKQHFPGEATDLDMAQHAPQFSISEKSLSTGGACGPDVEDRITSVERDLAALKQVVEETSHAPFSSGHNKDEKGHLPFSSGQHEEEKADETNRQAQQQQQEQEDERQQVEHEPNDDQARGKLEVRASSVYEFSESVWSASAFVGVVSCWESLTLMVAMALNTLIQVYFSALIVMNLGDLSDIGLADEDLEGFLSWRVSLAHHVMNFDEITNTSLATRVCHGWQANIASYTQLEHVSSFSSYLGDSDFVDLVFGGPGLALLCIWCWLSLVMLDFLDNWDFSAALLSNMGDSTVVALDDADVAFESVSRPRVLSLHLFVVLPRLAVASVLFLAVARFLLFTISLPDLILHAMALGFVLDFDEMLFTFLPETVRHALRNTAPLQVRHWLQSQHVHQRPFAFLVVAIVGSLFFYAETSDIVSRMVLAQDLLCGGRTSLVFAVNPATGVVTAAPTPGGATASDRCLRVPHHGPADWHREYGADVRRYVASSGQLGAWRGGSLHGWHSGEREVSLCDVSRGGVGRAHLCGP